MIQKRTHRRQPTRRTDHLIERLRQLSSEGLLQSDIARRLSVSASSVGRWQRAHGIAHPGRSDGRAIAMAADGFRWSR